MSYLVDTNVLSELRKKQRCAANVAAWLASVKPDELFVSVLSLGEIRRGIELLRRRDLFSPPARADLARTLARSPRTVLLSRTGKQARFPTRPNRARSTTPKKLGTFIGHPDAGQRSAIIYSLIVSCERRGKDPLAYLKDILTRLPRMTNQDDLSALTPANWQPA